MKKSSNFGSTPQGSNFRLTVTLHNKSVFHQVIIFKQFSGSEGVVIFGKVMKFESHAVGYHRKNGGPSRL